MVDGARHHALPWRSEVSFQELVLSYLSVDSGVTLKLPGLLVGLSSQHHPKVTLYPTVGLRMPPLAGGRRASGFITTHCPQRDKHIQTGKVPSS